MEWTDIIFSLLTLTLLEVVLGIDNLVFISIATNKLPKAERDSARKIGLILALVLRLLFLASVVWLVHITQPLFTIFNLSLSIRDLILLAGGLFLLYKATVEIHSEVESHDTHPEEAKYTKFSSVIVQIGLFDIIFSFDSVFTAVGMTNRYFIMATAITIAIIVMIFASGHLARFVERHPTIKMLALSFLLLIGVMLVADGFHAHIPRGYIYFAITFSILIEGLNTLVRRRQQIKP